MQCNGLTVSREDDAGNLDYEAQALDWERTANQVGLHDGAELYIKGGALATVTEEQLDAKADARRQRRYCKCQRLDIGSTLASQDCMGCTDTDSVLRRV